MVRRGVTRKVSCASFICASLFFAAPYSGAQDRPALQFRAGGEYAVPVAGDEAWFESGYSAVASAEYALWPLFAPVARAAFTNLPLKELDSLSVSEGALGLASRLDFLERFFVRAELTGGLYRASWQDYSAGGFAANLRTELGFRFAPAFRVSAAVGATRFFQGTDSLFTGVSAGVYFGVSPGALDSTRARIRFDSINLFSLFPVFYTYYGDHPFGYFEIRNDEDAAIRDVRVFFHSPEFMSRPTECAVIPVLRSGETARIPVTALFTERILSLTERTKTKSELSVEYRLIGAKRRATHQIDVPVYHRNAMTWSDDRRAAAFVSAQDPAVLWFSRFVNAVVRDRFRTGIDRNVQQAAAVFEALRLFGLAYVVDPSSAYVDSVGNEGAVDYLQYPHQTLMYRGGDCDDLSILFCSLLQSLGIESAFVTVPGHIYVAFAADRATPADAFDQGLAIRKDGRTWIPLEITMVKDGFVKAWRVGAKEWTDNDRQGEAKLYPMGENWRSYPPVGIPDVSARFQLPDEALTMRAFDASLDRYVAREIEPKLAELRKRMAKAPKAETDNAVGLLHARYGMLNEAWTYFSSSAKGAYAPAWINLANVAFIRRDYSLALQYYRYSAERAAFNPPALLGIARCEYELERYSAAEKAYADLRGQAPDTAARYSYLVSVFGGVGRAWSLADRASSVEWVDRLPAPPAAAIAAAPPPEKSASAPAPKAAPPAPTASVAAVSPPEKPPAAPEPAPAPAPAKPAPEAPAPAPEPAPAVLPTKPVPAEPPAEPEPANPAPPPEPAPTEPAASPAPVVATAPEPAEAPPSAAESTPEPAPSEPIALAEVSAPSPAEPAAAPVEALAPEAPAAAIAAFPAEPAAEPAVQVAAEDAAMEVPAPVFALVEPVEVAPEILEAAPVDADIAEREADRQPVPSEEPPASAPIVIPAPSASVALALPREAPPAIPAPVPETVPAPAKPVPGPVVDPAPVETDKAPPAPPTPPAVPEPPVVALSEERHPAPEVPELSLSVVPPGIDASAPVGIEVPEPIAFAGPELPAETGSDSYSLGPLPDLLALAGAPGPAEAAPDVVAAESPVAIAAAALPQEAAPAVAVESSEPSAVPEEPPESAPRAAPEAIVAAAPPPEAAPAEKAPVEKAPAPAPKRAPRPAPRIDRIAVVPGVSGIAGGSALRLDPPQLLSTLPVVLPAGKPFKKISFFAKVNGASLANVGVLLRIGPAEAGPAPRPDTVRLGGAPVVGALAAGASESLYLWVVSDPFRHPDKPERVQAFVSRDGAEPRLIADEPLPVPMAGRHQYALETDAERGDLVLSVAGVPCLRVPRVLYRLPRDLVFFQSKNSVTITDFRAESYPYYPD